MKNISAIFLTMALSVGFLVSNGFCETIDDIINSNSPFSDASSDGTRQATNPSTDTEGKSYAIQAGIYLDQDQADKQIIELKSKGLNPYIFQSLNSKNQTVYAVRIGQFQTWQAASDELDQIGNKLIKPVFITFYDSLDTVNTSDEPPSGINFVSNKTDLQEKVTKAESSDETYDSSQKKPSSPGSLAERLQSLESEVQKLKEEAEVRKKLQITEKEATEEQEDILEAAGREYSLTNAGNLQFSYGFGYSYKEYDAIRESVRVEDVSNHTISNSFSVSYGLKDNLSLGTSIPFVYKYHRVGTIDEKDVTDLGDLSLDWRWQPVKTNSQLPTIIVNGEFNVPVGRSPYEIQSGTELSTSSGFYSTSLGASVSQASDPVVVFSSCSIYYPLPVKDINQKRNEGVLDEIDPGAAIGVSAGMAYALSYKLSLNLSVSYSYSFETEYHYKNSPSAKSGTSASARLRLGTGYRLSPKQNLNFSFGIPVTDTGSFSFSFSTPIEFEL